MKNRRLIYIFITLTLFLPVLGVVQALDGSLQAPETLQEAKSWGQKFVSFLPDAFRYVWQELLKIGQKIWGEAGKSWNRYLLPWLENVWEKILSIFGQEVERRKEIIKKEFPGEKEEMKKEIKTEVPKISRSLWERFRELIK